MIRAGVHLQLAVHGVTHSSLRQHSAHGFLHQTNRLTLADDLGAFFAQPALVSAVPAVDLLLFLPPGELDLRGVDDHHVVASVDEGCVDSLVLALEQPRCQGGDATEDLAPRVNDMPPAIGALRARHKRTHEKGILVGPPPSGRSFRTVSFAPRRTTPRRTLTCNRKPQ